MNRLPRWVIAVIVLCCVIEAATQIATTTGWPYARSIIDLLGGFWPVLLEPGGHAPLPGQWLWMFATYGFLHGGVAHLGMNMFSLAALTPELNRFTGPARMALIYAATQVAAALVFAWMAPDKGPMVGASGAIFGLAGALVGYAFVATRARGLPLGPLGRSVAVLAGLNIALTLAMPAIAWEAHLGGALAGLIMGVAMALGDRTYR